MPPTTTSLDSRFLDFCQAHFHPDVSILVAVSGGSDSVALLRLFDKHKTKLRIKALAVIHVNHGLREEESDEDEAFVRELAVSLKLPFYVKRLSGADPNGSGIEMWARRERYTFFRSVMETTNFDGVVTAHTQDDQAETILMRLMRGSGIRGLRGILPVREDRVYRPLLKHCKAELEQWLHEINQPFRYDSSNSNIRFQRNRVRHSILPFMSKVSPDFTSNLASLSNRMMLMWNKLLPDIEKWIERNVTRDSKYLFIVKKSGLTDKELSSESLRILFEEFGVGFTRKHIEQLFENSKKSGRFLLPGKWLYCADKNSIIFFKENAYECFSRSLRNPGVSIFHDLNRSFNITEEQTPDLSSLPKDEVTIVIDQDTFHEKLVYRTVNEDDTFQPFGRKSSINLVQFLSRQGIAKPLQQNIGVVADQYNKIIWVPGIRVNDQCKVTEHTRSAIKISMKTISNII